MSGRHPSKRQCTGAADKRRRKVSKPLTIWDGDKYFDAKFTENERGDLRDRLMDVCGYGKADGLIGRNFMGFEYDIERPAQDVVWPAFCAQGLTYERDHGRLSDYALIHICRELQIEYKTFARNAPKLPIDGFIECAKRSFPEFKRPRNKIEAKIQHHKLYALWVDWLDEECPRLGCSCEHHWQCHDRFVERDHRQIIAAIAAYNETRPKLPALKMVYSRD